MTVLLLLGTFLVFIAIDFWFNRKAINRETNPKTEPSGPPKLLSYASIEGVLVPGQLRYHAGHTWLDEESPGVARAGADAFAAKLAGPVERVELPLPRRWIRQGQPAFKIWRGTECMELPSPVEGEIVEVNSALAADPGLLSRDPYNAGWLIKVNVPDPEVVRANLLPPHLVQAWMREEVRRTRRTEPAVRGLAVNEK